MKRLQPPIGTEIIEIGKMFKLRCVRILLAYRSTTCIDKKELINFLNFRMKENTSKMIVRYFISYGRDCDFVTYAFLGFNDTFQTKNYDLFNYGNLRPEFRKLTTSKDIRGIINHISCQDMEPLAYGIQGECLHDIVTSARNKIELLANCRSNEVIPAIKMYDTIRGIDDHVDLKPEFTTFRRWQKILDLELDIEPHPRKIIWIYDKEGDAGKSSYADHKEYLEPNKVVTLEFLSGIKDMNQLINTKFNSGNKCNKIFIMLEQSDTKIIRDKDSTLYKYIASLKNGKITVAKWETNTKKFSKPHVVVMSNHFPNLKGLSTNKWDIRCLTSENGEWYFDYYDVEGDYYYSKDEPQDLDLNALRVESIDTTEVNNIQIN